MPMFVCHIIIGACPNPATKQSQLFNEGPWLAFTFRCDSVWAGPNMMIYGHIWWHTVCVFSLKAPPATCICLRHWCCWCLPGNARRLRYLFAWPYGREPPFTRSTKSSELKSFCRSQTAEDWQQICRFPIKRLLSHTGQTWLHDL